MLLLDNSAWSRVIAGGLPADRAEAVAGWVEQRQLAICLPFLLEAGCSARANADYREIMDEFDLLFPRVEIAAAMEERALLAQRELAARGHHRLAPVDVRGNQTGLRDLGHFCAEVPKSMHIGAYPRTLLIAVVCRATTKSLQLSVFAVRWCRRRA